MPDELRLLTTVVGLLGHTLTTRPRPRRAPAHDDAGYTTEAVVVIALMVALALTAVGILTARILAKVNSIDLG
jgi:hypothetical protein